MCPFFHISHFYVGKNMQMFSSLPVILHFLLLTTAAFANMSNFNIIERRVMANILYDLTTGMTYTSQQEAAARLGVNQGNLSRAVKNFKSIQGHVLVPHEEAAHIIARVAATMGFTHNDAHPGWDYRQVSQDTLIAEAIAQKYIQ